MNIISVSLVGFQKYREKIPVQNGGECGNWLFRLSDTEFNRNEVVLAVKKITSAFVQCILNGVLWVHIMQNHFRREWIVAQ
jgi:hypothetical protein